MPEYKQKPHNATTHIIVTACGRDTCTHCTYNTGIGFKLHSQQFTYMYLVAVILCTIVYVNILVLTYTPRLVNRKPVYFLTRLVGESTYMYTL